MMKVLRSESHPGIEKPARREQTALLWRRVALAWLGFALYGLFFLGGFELLGGQSGLAAGVVLPTVASAWLLGIRAGLLAALLALPVNTLLLNLVGEPGWDVIVRSGGLPGMAAGALLATMVGSLSELVERVAQQRRRLEWEQAELRREVAERRTVEASLRQSETRFRLLVEQSTEVFFYVHDRDHHFEYVSPSVQAVLGYPPAELVGQRYEGLLMDHPLNEVCMARTAAALQTGERLPSYEVLVRHRAGHAVYLEVVEGPIMRGGQVVGLQGFARDISTRKREEQLRTALYEVAQSVHESSDLAELLQRIHRTVGQLLPTENFYVALCVEEQPDTFYFVYEVDEHDTFGDQLYHIPRTLTAQVARSGQPLWVDRQRYQALVTAGEVAPLGTLPASWLGVPLKLKERVLGVVAVQSYADAHLYGPKEIEIMVFISSQLALAIERKRTEQALWESKLALEYLAHHDTLTQLPNRVLFYERLSQALAGAQQGACLALLYLDLDLFKEVNDTLGHEVGDRLLQEVARRLLGCVAPTHTVARIGGDEFVVILPALAHLEEAALCAEALLAALAPPFAVGTTGGHIHIETSIGISRYGVDGTNAESLVRQADRAMYQAKRQGRNRFAWASAPLPWRGMAGA